MSFWDYDNIRTVVGGTWLARPEPGSAADGVSIDTRTTKRGHVFVALPGERTDGHRFLGDAADAGAAMALVQDPATVQAAGGIPKGLGVLHVPDTRKSLGRLAAAYRKTLENTRVIAVTGSNGKTTTVRLIEAVLSSKLRGSASIKSFNNDIGVPLTILGAKRGDQYLICEVGTNAPGEIAQLSSIVSPDIAVITSIGREHLEFLGSIRGVCQEESSVLGALRPGGLAVVTADCPELDDFLKGPANLVRFGFSERAELRITAAEPTLDGVAFTLNARTPFHIPLLGRHNASNAAAAVAVGRRLRLDDETIREALAATKAPEMRLQRQSIAGIDLLNDAYNANPDSMLAGLQALLDLGGDAKRRVVVFGDMLELGPAAAPGHLEVANALAASGTIDLAVLVGPTWATVAGVVREAFPKDRVLSLNDVDADRAATVAAMLRPGDLVLLKGSRRMGLERVATALAAAHNVAPLPGSRPVPRPARAVP
jgi:UDP-N-acetylmuramoyl-tripeptide--D-alanyl-D-alanine ligase